MFRQETERTWAENDRVGLDPYDLLMSRMHLHTNSAFSK